MKFSCNKNINNAIIGVSSSIVSDLVVNRIRIIKTYKQSNCDYISYNDIIKRIVKEDKNILKSVFRGFGLRTSLDAFNSGFVSSNLEKFRITYLKLFFISKTYMLEYLISGIVGAIVFMLIYYFSTKKNSTLCALIVALPIMGMYGLFNICKNNSI